MNKSRYIKRVFGLCFLAIVICWGWMQPRAVLADVKNNGTLAVGRDNPFEKISRKEKSLPQELLQGTHSNEDSPVELFIEIVSLKVLDARSIADALEKLCSEYGSVTADEKTNSLIICDIKEHIEKILAQVQRLEATTLPQSPARGEEETPELFVEVITLKFLDAKSTQATLEKMSSKYGSVSIDSKTNSLIICDTKEVVKKILAEIAKVDKTPQQIMVEVVILDVQLKDDTEIGINWDLMSSKDYDISYKQAMTTSTKRLTSDSKFVTGGLGGDFTVISGTVRNLVHMIQEKKDVEILASPRAMMVSGQSAFIKAVEEIPYTEVTDTSEGGASALTSTEFKEVGVNLEVTATITDGNDIFLTVKTEQNVKTGESSGGVPVVDTREAQTSLLLGDGQIVVMGGLRRQEETKEVDQIPILGDLPIIGELFKSTNTVIYNSELIVFLSPHIYRGEPIPDDAMAKYDEIRGKTLLSLPEDKSVGIKEMLSILAPVD